MKCNQSTKIVLLFLILITLTACGQDILIALGRDIANSENPPPALQESDLIGTWKADYDFGGDDTLILREDGKFKQIYKNQRENYVYETPWNEWWLERFPDGRMRVHLKGARYYLDGIPLAEIHESEPWTYCDPFAMDKDWRDWSVNMVRQLILNVRSLPSGELVLAHMWSGCGDAAFGPQQVFHRVEVTLTMQTPTP